MWLIACVINKLWICGSICRDNLKQNFVEIHITIRPGKVEIHITIYPGKVTKVVSPLNNVTKDLLLPRRRFILKHTTTKIDLSLV